MSIQICNFKNLVFLFHSFFMFLLYLWDGSRVSQRDPTIVSLKGASIRGRLEGDAKWLQLWDATFISLYFWTDNWVSHALSQESIVGILRTSVRRSVYNSVHISVPVYWRFMTSLLSYMHKWVGMGWGPWARAWQYLILILVFYRYMSQFFFFLEKRRFWWKWKT